MDGPFSGNITQHNLHSMDSLVTRITSEASQYVNNVDSWVVGFRNYYVSNLGHSQGMAIRVVEFSNGGYIISKIFV